MPAYEKNKDLSTPSKARIFLFCCLAFIAATGLASFLPVPFLGERLYLFSGLAVAAVSAVLFWRNRTSRIVALLILSFLFGIWRFSLSIPEDSPDKVWSYDGQTVRLVGFVAAPPEPRETDTRYEIETEEIFLKGRGWRRIGGKVLVTAKSYPERHYGDELELLCDLKRPVPVQDFAYDRYLARFDIYALCYFPEIRPTGKNQARLFYKEIFSLKGRMEGLIGRSLAEPESSLGSSILFGGQEHLDPGLKEAFSRTGLSHITAVSGMNVTILAALAGYLFSFLGLKRKFSFFLSSLLLTVYVVLVGAPASAVRAGLMGFLVLWALYLGRLNRLTNALLLAASVMLLINPRLLRSDIGFQLSFLAVLGLIYLYPFLEKFWPVKNLALKSLKDGFFITLAAQVFTFPVLALNFSRVSLVAPLANLAILWAIPALTAALSAALLPAALLPTLAPLIFLPSGLLLKYIIKAASFLASSPFAYREIYFSRAWMAAYFLLLSGLVLFLKIRERQKLEAGSDPW